MSMDVSATETDAWPRHHIHQGKGNWASVYLLRRVQTGAHLLAGLGEKASSAAPPRQVLKVLGEANVWEMHVSSLLYRTVAEEAKVTRVKKSTVIWTRVLGGALIA